MSTDAPTIRRCQHIKVNGIQCGSPAKRNENIVTSTKKPVSVAPDQHERHRLRYYQPPHARRPQFHPARPRRSHAPPRHPPDRPQNRIAPPSRPPHRRRQRQVHQPRTRPHPHRHRSQMRRKSPLAPPPGPTSPAGPTTSSQPTAPTTRKTTKKTAAKTAKKITIFHSKPPRSTTQYSLTATSWSCQAPLPWNRGTPSVRSEDIRI